MNFRDRLILFQILILSMLAPIATALPIKSEVVKQHLSLTMVLGKAELDQCAANMVRKAQTLAYTCQLDIPIKSKNAKLHSLLSSATVPTVFGGTKRDVQIEISPDARVLSLTTSFDATGLDLELSKFNDDFYAVYAQAAHTIISDALKRHSIKMEVLESRK